MMSSVEIEWDFYRKPSELWEAWTREELMCRWFGSDPEGRVLSAKLDVRVGGRFEVRFVGSDGIEHACYGEYRDLVKDYRLRSTWNWVSEPGDESEVSLLLLPTKYGTRMLFKHEGNFQSTAHHYEKGWESTFHKLERLLG